MIYFPEWMTHNSVGSEVIPGLEYLEWYIDDYKVELEELARICHIDAEGVSDLKLQWEQMRSAVNYYKIRRKSDKLYSSGGSMPIFVTLGKAWPLPQLRSHLRMLQNGYGFACYNDCELVIYTELIQQSDVTLEDMMEPYKQELTVRRLKGE